ncbi:hypothetical protein FWC31_01865 [Candidatus Saccharibacteria bacterium]|nr:hypothetical protein [Candidatus Saccharibacteria bacterium]
MSRGKEVNPFPGDRFSELGRKYRRQAYRKILAVLACLTIVGGTIATQFNEVQQLALYSIHQIAAHTGGWLPEASLQVDVDGNLFCAIEETSTPSKNISTAMGGVANDFMPMLDEIPVVGEILVTDETLGVSDSSKEQYDISPPTSVSLPQGEIPIVSFPQPAGDGVSFGVDDFNMEFDKIYIAQFELKDQDGVVHIDYAAVPSAYVLSMHSINNHSGSTYRAPGNLIIDQLLIHNSDEWIVNPDKTLNIGGNEYKAISVVSVPKSDGGSQLNEAIRGLQPGQMILNMCDYNSDYNNQRSDNYMVIVVEIVEK